MLGKLPPDILKDKVLRHAGAARREVIVGGGLGEDAALIRWADDSPYLVAASDPITGASEGAGRLLVHVNANDVACKGADPSWLIVTMIIPARDGISLIEKIMREIHEACLELDIAVVGGHTELTDRYDRPVLSATMLGPAKRRLSVGEIKSGDAIIATGHAGLEGMSILAHDRPDLLKGCLTSDEIETVKGWSNDMSVVRAARVLREFASYMHDPTEGGLMGALLEIQEACGLCMDLYDDGIPVSPLTLRVASAIGFDPLRLISSGMLLAVVPEDMAGEARDALDLAGIPSSTIGRFTEPREARHNAEGSSHGGDMGMPPASNPVEELWGILARPQL